MLLNLYHELLFRPLLNLLVFFYNILGDLGFAIIALTIVVRLILYPIAKKSLEHQKSLKEIQPKIKELQEKHKEDKEKLTSEMMLLYKEHNFNPASGCLPMIIQIVILLALYQVFVGGLNLDANQLYGFVTHPNHLNTNFLGLFDLNQKSMELHLTKLLQFNFSQEAIKVINYYGIFLAVCAAFFQFLQTKMTIGKTMKQKEEEKTNQKEKKEENPFDISEAMNTQMLYFFPLLTFYIGVSFQSGLSLYWTVSTLLLLLQQYILDKNSKKA